VVLPWFPEFRASLGHVAQVAGTPAHPTLSALRLVYILRLPQYRGRGRDISAWRAA
jgi:hypothetical protein